MKQMIRVFVLSLVLLSFVLPTSYAADFAPIFPKHATPVVASPNLTWATGEYDLFRLVMILPLPSGYRVIPLWRDKPYFHLPEGWWDVVEMDGWCLWLVLGINTSTHAYEVTSLQYFQKVNDCVVNFPDANLEAVIREEIARPTGDIRASDLETIGFLYAAGLGISDIGGLEYCVNLIALDLSDNQIVDVSPLAGLNNLEWLNLGFNHWIEDVSPLAGLNNLALLHLWRNQIVNVSPLAALTNLTDLQIDQNQIVDVSPLAGLTDLGILMLGSNQIVNVSPLADLKNLIDLQINQNQIVDMCPLVDNLGLDSGDSVYLSSNPLSATSCTVCIPTLESRGVNVGHDCPVGGPMAQIPAGCFDMGDHFGEGDEDELPVHNVCISAFNMDVHEVTNSEYAECVDDGGCTPPAYTSSFSRLTYYGDPAYDDFPVTYVNWHQAQDYCTWAGKRLPTEAEWEYAARGGLAGKRYPWGDTISYADANYWDPSDPWNNDTSQVEYYAPNGYGLYDVAGNLWEWVSDWYSSTYYQYCVDHGIVDDPPGTAIGPLRGLRGGAWSYGAQGTRVAYRWSIDPDHEQFDVGFRCARGGAFGP